MVSPELMTWLAVPTFMVGFFALPAEIIIVPGFGVAGVAGVILIGWGGFTAIRGFYPGHGSAGIGADSHSGAACGGD